MQKPGAVTAIPFNGAGYSANAAGFHPSDAEGAASVKGIGPRSLVATISRRLPLWTGLALFVIYIANCRVIGIGDAIPATLLPLTILRGEGIALDRFQSVLTVDGQLPYYATMRHGHLVSLYPIGSALVAIPFIWPQIFVKDLVDPGWDANPARALVTSMWMAKFAAAAITSLACVALMSLLFQLGLRSVALISTLAAGLGSDLWVIASQSLWQHGSAALAFALVLLVFTRPKQTRTSLLLAGLATAVLVCCRATMLLFALPIAAWVVVHERRGSPWFFLMPSVGAAMLIGFNYWWFGSILGGASIVESSAAHLPSHGVTSAWSANLLEGCAGTLVSPSRGLFIFAPWVAVSLFVLLFSRSRLRDASLVHWLFWTLPVLLLLNSAYSVWWGGYSFGPRYWTEATLLFALALAAAADWSRVACKPVYGLLLATIVYSVAVQMLGAFCYPSGWNWEPVSVDVQHERLWDWRDNELVRCRQSGLRPLWRVDGIQLPE